MKAGTLWLGERNTDVLDGCVDSPGIPLQELVKTLTFYIPTRSP